MRPPRWHLWAGFCFFSFDAVKNHRLDFGRDWSAHDPESWPSIFTAVQEQLGLKLDAVHESVPNLVVDHITKPTEN